MKRAVQTSRICTQFNIEPNIDDRINAKDRGVETDEMIDERLESFMTDLEKTLEHSEIDDVIIVTHSRIVTILLLYIIGPKCNPGLTMERYNELDRGIENTSISKISIRMNASQISYKVEYCNNIDHLN